MVPALIDFVFENGSLGAAGWVLFPLRLGLAVLALLLVPVVRVLASGLDSARRTL